MARTLLSVLYAVLICSASLFCAADDAADIATTGVPPIPVSCPGARERSDRCDRVRQHECMHDYPEIQNLIAKDLAATAGTLQHEDQVAGRKFEAKALGPLRIHVSTFDLYQLDQYCLEAGDVVPDFGGNMLTCTSKDVLTPLKRSKLVTEILPVAIERLSTRLKVERMTSNLIVNNRACSHFTKPPFHSTSGVPDADFVLYLAAGPMSTGSVIAWAGSCQLNSAGRSIVGRMGFNPQWLDGDADRESLIDTVVHEMLHALGFSPTFYKDFVETTYRRGKQVSVLRNMPTVTSFAAMRFKCPSMDGVELEDELTSGIGSHLERRLFDQDIMSGAGGGSISNIVLAVLGDLNVGYYPDYSHADKVGFGEYGGCSFMHEKCDTDSGGKNTFFCFDRNHVGCTFDRKAIGKCRVTRFDSPLPEYFQYFDDPYLGGRLNFMDRCPVIESYENRVCDDASYEARWNEVLYGYTFARDSRCVATSPEFLKTGYSGQSMGFRCLRVRCPGGTRAQVSTASSDWVDCPLDGSAGRVTIPGYNGYVDCPAAAELCDAGTYYAE
jgi:leishmanolysin